MELGSSAIGNLVFLADLLVLMALVAVSTVRTGRLLRTWTPPFNPLLSLPENVLRLGLIGICIALGYVFGPGPAALGWGTAHLGRDLVVGAILGVVMAGLFAVAGQAAVNRWGAEVYDDRLLRCILPVSRREWPGVALALLPAAALEELLFRSLPLGGLTWLIAPHWLMWPLAVFFGLLHWPQGGWGVAGTTLAAILLSLLFLATGSIWPSLAAHYVMNVLQVAVAVRAGLRPLRVRFRVLHADDKDLIEYGRQNQRRERCAPILMPSGMNWPRKC
jgi:membrane protease YdiL (CAAX protease family)